MNFTTKGPILVVGKQKIRMSEVKGSLNVGVACGIVLHAWNVQASMTDYDA